MRVEGVTRTGMNTTLYIIIPCYNEEEVLPITSKLFLEELQDLIQKEKVSADSRILFVNDGSKDATWNVIERLAEENKHFIGISQSRNRGHQNALWAGMMEVKEVADITISIDCDGQDDIRTMEAMVDAYHDGCEVVYGVRSNRDTDTFFKRHSAEMFYHLMRKLGADVVYNHADYRLMSRRALEGLAEFSEVNLFLRGIVPMIGYPSDVVYYDRKERAAGESKYPLKKMLAFAIEGITSLSTKPIRMITFMGIAAFFVSIGFLIWAVVDFFRGNTITGWASMMVSIWFIGGLLLLSVGIVGEYVGKIYLESKHRPRYIIESRTPDRIREREKGRSRRQEMPGENVRRSRAEARELQTSKRREAVQKPEQE